MKMRHVKEKINGRMAGPRQWIFWAMRKNENFLSWKFWADTLHFLYFLRFLGRKICSFNYRVL